MAFRWRAHGFLYCGPAPTRAGDVHACKVTAINDLDTIADVVGVIQVTEFFIRC